MRAMTRLITDLRDGQSPLRDRRKPPTRNLDDWSQSVKRSTRVSAYPLAAWLASSWWRLRYEPLPVGNRANSSWRMKVAHEVAASGYGYLWPQIVFHVTANDALLGIPTDANDGQPVRYLTGARQHQYQANLNRPSIASFGW